MIIVLLILGLLGAAALILYAGYCILEAERAKPKAPKEARDPKPVRAVPKPPVRSRDAKPGRTLPEASKNYYVEVLKENSRRAMADQEAAVLRAHTLDYDPAVLVREYTRVQDQIGNQLRDLTTPHQDATLG